MASASPSSSSGSGSQVTVKTSAWKESRQTDLFMPSVRDVNQYSSAAFGNTVFQVGTPPRRENPDRLVPSSLFNFGFGSKNSIPDVVQAGDPVLHEHTLEVPLKDIGTPELERTINNMIAVMRTAPGVGLSANQIGVPLQIMVLEDTKALMAYSSPEEVAAQDRRPFELLVIINPKLTPIGDAKAIFFEGCLSVEGYRAMVERYLQVEVTGLDRSGQPITVRASGWQARILQHEYDHLMGTLYVDKIVPRTFRSKQNLRMPLPAGCPKCGVQSCESAMDLE